MRIEVDVESPDNLSKYYDLVSNVTHTSLSGTARAETQWKTYVHLTPPRDKDGEYVEGVKEEDEKWFEMQDLVVQEIERNLVGLGESYIQVRSTLFVRARGGADEREWVRNRFGREEDQREIMRDS